MSLDVLQMFLHCHPLSWHAVMICGSSAGHFWMRPAPSPCVHPLAPLVPQHLAWHLISHLTDPMEQYGMAQTRSSSLHRECCAPGASLNAREAPSRCCPLTVSLVLGRLPQVNALLHHAAVPATPASQQQAAIGHDDAAAFRVVPCGHALQRGGDAGRRGDALYARNNCGSGGGGSSSSRGRRIGEDEPGSTAHRGVDLGAPPLPRPAPAHLS